MNMALLIFLLMIASFAAAIWLTGLMRGYAIRVRLVDEVSTRSSHQEPTPRGGGMSIIIVATLGLLISALWLGFPTDVAVGLIGGGIMVALVGWIDDHGHVRASVRLLVHFAAAIWAVQWIGPLSLHFIPIWTVSIVALEWPLTVLLFVWMINLYNFMDGIDGIAGSECVCVTLAGAFLLAVAGAGAGWLAPPLLLAAATLGFLRWNWPPAKIFMGDASSGFLGFTLAALTLIAWDIAPRHGIAWIVLLGVFIVDATFTLLWRASRGEPVYEAHRTHAFQRLSQRWGSHLPVTVGVIIFNVLWLFPMAGAITQGWIGPIVGVCVAYTPLIIAALLIGAGSKADIVETVQAPVTK